MPSHIFTMYPCTARIDVAYLLYPGSPKVSTCSGWHQRLTRSKFSAGRNTSKLPTHLKLPSSTSWSQAASKQSNDWIAFDISIPAHEPSTIDYEPPNIFLPIWLWVVSHNGSSNPSSSQVGGHIQIRAQSCSIGKGETNHLLLEYVRPSVLELALSI